jgi:hypothetical protein
MSDNDVQGMIESLVREEHELWDREARGESTDSDRRRLNDIKVQLDQYWDLLRQRRARERAGLDPDDASLRDEGTVERYLQ